MTPEQMKSAARYLRWYANAVESKLYINMRVEEAHDKIVEAIDLAQLLEAEAYNREDFRSIPE